MEIQQTHLEGCVVLKPKVFQDSRGFFVETWRESTFEQLGIDEHFVQDNHSRSPQGTLRGLHYQVKNSQGKLVRVARGKVFDVCVDLREESETFGQWFGTILDDVEAKQLYVPPRFAHGFYVLSDVADFVYKCTEYYAPEYDRTLLWNDPAVGIDWGLLDDSPLLSEKDRIGTQFGELEIPPKS